jgi:hypothetical protein
VALIVVLNESLFVFVAEILYIVIVVGIILEMLVLKLIFFGGSGDGKIQKYKIMEN